MTKEEFKRALKKLGISQRKFAKEIDMDVGTVNRWATGKAHIPGITDAYIRLRLKIKELTGE